MDALFTILQTGKKIIEIMIMNTISRDGARKIPWGPECQVKIFQLNEMKAYSENGRKRNLLPL